MVTDNIVRHAGKAKGFQGKHVTKDDHDSSYRKIQQSKRLSNQNKKHFKKKLTGK